MTSPPLALITLDDLAWSAQLPEGSRLPFAHARSFNGRDVELQVLAKALAYPKAKRDFSGVALCAVDGMGKTQLAVEFCHRYGHFFRGVHWLQADQDLALEMAACGFAMGIKPFPLKVAGQVDATLAAWDADQPRLVILDNVIDVTAVQAWLPRLAGLRLLVTARDADIARALSLPVISLNAFTPEESRALLCRLAPRLADLPSGELDELAERLEHHPQALDLAGRCLFERGDLTPATYLGELARALDILRQALSGEHAGPIPALALAYAVNWKVMRSADNSDFAWHIFHACAFCAPGVAVDERLLQAFISVSLYTPPKKQSAAAAQRQIEVIVKTALGLLYRLGLLVPGECGPAIHPLVAEFARWMERVAGEGSALPELAETLADLVEKAREEEHPERIAPLHAHLQAVAAAAEDHRMDQAGKLWASLGYYLASITEYAGAELYYERALFAVENSLGSDHPQLASVLLSAGEVLEAEEKIPAARVCYEQALRIYEKVFGQQHPSAARAVSRLARIMAAQGDLEGAQAGYEQALVIFRRELGTRHPRLSATVGELGDVLLGRGRPAEARACYLQAQRIDEALYGSHHPNLARRAASLGRALLALEDIKGALEYFQHALSIMVETYGLEDERLNEYIDNVEDLLRSGEKMAGVVDAKPRPAYERILRLDEMVYGSGNPRLAARALQMGESLEEQGALNSAKACYMRGLRLLETIHGRADPHLVEALNHAGKIHYDLGDFSAAEALYRRSLNICESAYTREHPAIIAAFANLGQVLWQQGNLEEAKTCFLRVLVMREVSDGPEHPNTASAANYLGSVLWQQGDPSGAQACFERALRIDEATYGMQHAAVSRDVNNLGDALYRQGNFDAARRCFERALDIAEAIYGPEHPDTAAVLNNLGGVLWAQRNLSGARALYEQALRIDETAGGPEHPSVARDAANLANVFKSLGENEKAREMYTRALNIRQRHLPADHPKVTVLKKGLEDLEHTGT